MPLPPADLGRQAEHQAKKLLKNKGYRFITANFRTKFGEIDLIFLDKKQLVFVEVKARSRVEQGRPEEAVTPHKLYQITRVANHFMQTHPDLPQHGRIDVVAITPNSINHLENISV